MTVYQLKNGMIKARTRLRLYNGKTAFVQAVGKSVTAAKRNLEQRCVDRLGTDNGGVLTNSSTVDQLLDEWRDQHEVKARTAETYRKICENHIEPALGGLRINEVTTQRIQQFIDTLSEATARLCRSVLSSAFGLAVRWGIIQSNPVREVALKKRMRKEVHALTNAQMDEYRDRVERWCESGARPRGDGLVEIVDVLRGSGMRIGEVLALRWRDVDLDLGTVIVCGTTDERQGRQEFPKTESSRRVIRITDTAVYALRRQWEKPYREALGEMVFPSSHGTYRTVNNVERQLRAARGDLTIRPHDFRKTVATRIEERFGVMAASRHLGHSSTRVTEQAYLAAPAVVDDYTRAIE